MKNGNGNPEESNVIQAKHSGRSAMQELVNDFVTIRPLKFSAASAPRTLPQTGIIQSCSPVWAD